MATLPQMQDRRKTEAKRQSRREKAKAFAVGCVIGLALLALGQLGAMALVRAASQAAFDAHPVEEEAR